MCVGVTGLTGLMGLTGLKGLPGVLVVTGQRCQKKEKEEEKKKEISPWWDNRTTNKERWNYSADGSWKAEMSNALNSKILLSFSTGE